LPVAVIVWIRLDHHLDLAGIVGAEPVHQSLDCGGFRILCDPDARPLEHDFFLRFPFAADE
jgi:hypothetical protein